MAVSHQWFIQWLPPSMVLADVNREYHNINHQWNDERSSPMFQNLETNYDPYEQPNSVQSYEQPPYEDDLQEANFKYNGEFYFLFKFSDHHHMEPFEDLIFRKKKSFISNSLVKHDTNDFNKFF